MKNTVVIRIGLLAVAAIVGGYLWYLGNERAGMARLEQTTGEVAIGGSFSLIDQNGVRRTEKDFSDKPILVFFGYTYCPDVCPTTLAIMSRALEQLGADAERITPIMITVDPKRDTPEVLKGYLASFGPSFVGLTGTEEEIAAAARAYKVFYKPAGPEPDAILDHSSIIYLMDRNGRYLAHYTLDTDPDAMAKSIREKL